MKRKPSKARRKRWLKSRVKAYKRAKFVEGFRNHFVAKGILKGGKENGEN